MARPATDTSGQIQKKDVTHEQTMTALVEQMRSAITMVLPKHMTPERMCRLALYAIRTNPKLMSCTSASFGGCIMTAAQLGLEPNTPLGQLYLIPRNNSRIGAMECTLIIGYQGMMDLSYRSDKMAMIQADVVRDGDYFDYQKGSDPFLKHKPAEDNQAAALTHAYAVAKLKNGATIFNVLTAQEVGTRRAMSQSANSGYSPWKTHPEAMWKKSAVRALWTWLPKSTEMALAAAVSDATEDGRPLKWDADVSDALKNAGIRPEMEIAVDDDDKGETEEKVDLETGEVTP